MENKGDVLSMSYLSAKILYSVLCGFLCRYNCIPIFCIGITVYQYSWYPNKLHLFGIDWYTVISNVNMLSRQGFPEILGKQLMVGSRIF